MSCPTGEQCENWPDKCATCRRNPSYEEDNERACLDDNCKPKFTLCGYSNCFKPFYKMRGFMPTCEFHFKNPWKWGKDGHTYTGSVWRRKE